MEDIGKYIIVALAAAYVMYLFFRLGHQDDSNDR